MAAKNSSSSSAAAAKAATAAAAPFVSPEARQSVTARRTGPTVAAGQLGLRHYMAPPPPTSLAAWAPAAAPAKGRGSVDAAAADGGRDINESADAFIKRFRQNLRLQRLESIEEFHEMLERGR